MTFFEVFLPKNLLITLLRMDIFCLLSEHKNTEVSKIGRNFEVHATTYLYDLAVK